MAWGSCGIPGPTLRSASGVVVQGPLRTESRPLAPAPAFSSGPWRGRSLYSSPSLPFPSVERLERVWNRLK